MKLDLKELRKELHRQKAEWSIPEELGDEMDMTRALAEFGLGSLPVPPGQLTARHPRVRPAEDAPLRKWDPKVFPTLRKTVKALPKTWDWRNVNGKNWVVPIRNQGGCGACVAFASAAAVEAHWEIQKGNNLANPDLSEAALFFANNRQCQPGDPRYGWHVPAALDYLVSEGDCFEPNYPYSPVNQTAQLVEGTERTFKISGYDSSTSRDQMKRWLFEDGPLVTSFSVYEDFMTYWNGGAAGIYSHVTGLLKGGHAVLVVGFDDNQSCWICKNSWTPRMGNDGFFRIKYGQCGIDARMYVVQNVYEVFTRDEIRYNPATLRIVDEGANGWLLTDGRSRMKMFDTKEDARNGMMVARRHNLQGFIGRDNPRSNRMDYIIEYWAGNSGLPSLPLTRTDCIPYNPTKVVAEDVDAQGWRLKEGSSWMLLAHDMNDALAALNIVERHTKMCFIGRGNKRPNRKSYIMTYWE